MFVFEITMQVIEYFHPPSRSLYTPAALVTIPLHIHKYTLEVTTIQFLPSYITGSQCVPWTNCIIITWELIRITKFQALPDLRWMNNLGMGLRKLV